ncbi:hypothetical protein GGS26DRAFT_432189 [Hypomontagnella submonticulosa]|nr:hypothetical protein GGS26DRAFT_432189 [Hypomontagnella submonticulosa]
MDPVSITLGVVPLVGGAIGAYGMIQKKFTIFCHYSREVRRVRKRLDRQQHFFRNETHLLLRPAVDDEATLECMLDDANHANWPGKELERGLRDHLGKNYGACQEIIEEITETIDGLRAELQCFEELSSQRQKGEPLKDTIRRLRNKVKIAWDKDKFDGYIKDLRDSNHDLKRLREQADELQKPKTQSTPLNRPKKLAQEYGNFRTIRRASKALYNALTVSWLRASATGRHDVNLLHNVKLFADAKVREQVHMDIALVCYGHDPTRINLMRPNLTRLRVQSQLLDWMESGFGTPPQHDDGGQKRRKVHFADDYTDLSASTTPNTLLSPGNSNSKPTQSNDLSDRHLCLVSAEKELQSPFNHVSDCLGHMDSCSEEVFRHSFYQYTPDESNLPPKKYKLHPKDIVSMSRVMRQPAENSLSIVDQLKLARSIVAAVLKFQSTPWLRQCLTVDDISFFKTGEDFSKYLPTLHFDVDFGQNNTGGPDESMGGVEAEIVAAFEYARLHHGIRNMTLWSLGTILLQIGRWDRMESPNDVFTVRKLSSQVPVLGTRYQQLTQRCLECDFGYGNDLSKPRLQQAIYESLVCELSEMINSLDINT